MLGLDVCRTDIELDSDEFRSIMENLADSGWNSAAVEIDRTVARLAGRTVPRVASAATRGEKLSAGADFIFHEDGILFAINSPRETLENTFQSGRYYHDWEIERGIPLSTKGVMLGAVTSSPNDARPLLDRFLISFESAAINALDGKHTKFDWMRVSSHEPFDTLKSKISSGDTDVKFEAPSMDDNEQAAAEILSDEPIRLLLREICAASFVRESDIMAKRKDSKKHELEEALTRLKESSLISSEHLLQCRKTSTSLTRITSPTDLNDSTAANLVCANCNRRFSEELLTEGYTASEMGKRLMRGSHWMTIYVTMQLESLGLERESILWNIEQSGEEVDIVAGFMDRLWIFELKDRDFGSGDAHPLNYRKVRYKADEAVVVTSSKVLTDARRVFEDLAHDQRRTRFRQKQAILIEGLNQVFPRLKTAFEEAATDRAKGFLFLPSVATGFDLRAALDQTAEDTRSLKK